MRRKLRPRIPQDIGELTDHLSFMMLYAPNFVDDTGYFPSQNLETTFYSLNQGLQVLRAKLGEDRYLRLVNMSNQMRSYFETDSEKDTGSTSKGRQLILDMKGLIKARRAKP